MIGLAVVMMRVRRAHAITIFLLGTLAIAAAVAPSVYVRTAQRSVAAVDVATATPGQRTIVVGSTVVVRAVRAMSIRAAARQQPGARLRPQGERCVADPGFDSVFTVSVVVDRGGRLAGTGRSVPGTLAEPEQPLEFRHGFCDHVVIVAGRCAGWPGRSHRGREPGRHAPAYAPVARSSSGPPT